MRLSAVLARLCAFRPDRLHALALLGAGAAFFALANPVARFPLLIVLFHWCLARIAFLASSPRQALNRAYLCGVLAAGASLYWIALPVHDFGYLPWILALPCPALMALALGAYPAGLSWILAKARGGLSPLSLGLLAGTAWWSIEALRGWLFTGFPWLCSAAALAPWPAALQSLSVIGAYGLGGVLAACAAWLAVPSGGLACRIAPAGVVLVLIVQGLSGMNSRTDTVGSFKAAVIQGNVDQSVKWDPAYQADTVEHYLALSQTSLSDDPDIILWPETAMPLYLQDASTLSAKAIAFSARTGLPLVTGAPGYTRSGKEPLLYNRAFLALPRGLEAFYDKEHLVPFGEYAPFGAELPILRELLQGVGVFTPGVRTAPLVTGRLAMGMLICYESIFAELAQKRVAQGANVLVNISNDAWFGRSSAPSQHLDLAVLRAVEQRRFVVRCTNTGISALIDPHGRVLAATPLFEDAAVTFGPVGLIETTTLFHRLYGLLQWAAAGLATGLAGLALYRQRQTKV